MHTLHSRILRSIMLLIGVGTVIFVLLIRFAGEQMEYSLLDNQMRDDAATLREQIAAGHVDALPQLARTRAWLETQQTASAPPALAALPLGVSHDVEWDGSRYHVRREQLDAGLLTIAVNIDELERREAQFNLVLFLGGFGMCVLVAALGYFMSRQISEPVRRMARELSVAGLPEPDFAARYQGAEIEAIARAVDAYTRRQNQLLEHERNFSAATSHELRTPLTVIRSSLELALMNTPEGDPGSRALQRALAASGELADTLDGLLALSREQTVEAAEPVWLDRVLKEVIQGVPASARQRIRLRCEPVQGLIIEAHWRAVCQNLINNALRHAPSGPIAVSLDDAAFEVCDEGPGFPTALLNRGFGAWRRGQESEGHGLGLYIVQTVLERYGAGLEAGNLPGGGACVRVSGLPNRVSPN